MRTATGSRIAYVQPAGPPATNTGRWHDRVWPQRSHSGESAHDGRPRAVRGPDQALSRSSGSFGTSNKCSTLVTAEHARLSDAAAGRTVLASSSDPARGPGVPAHRYPRLASRTAAPAFPGAGTGRAHQRRAGRGVGSTLRLPALPSGSGPRRSCSLRSPLLAPPCGGRAA